MGLIAQVGAAQQADSTSSPAKKDPEPQHDVDPRQRQRGAAGQNRQQGFGNLVEAAPSIAGLSEHALARPIAVSFAGLL